MDFILVGYLPKRRTTRAAWVSPYPKYPDATFPVPPPVEEIGSVSRCVAVGPDMKMEGVPFNHFGCYESAEDAWRAVPSVERHAFDLFAYGIGVDRYRDGKPEPVDFTLLDPLPMTDTFVLLGYDAVAMPDYSSMGCSPLSCNGQGGEAVLNRYCLVDTEAEGLELARKFSISQPEPGPYVVAEVWRDTGTSRVA